MPTIRTKGNTDMIVNYKKLWKSMKDRDMKKKNSEVMSYISHHVISRLICGENVTVDVLGWICKAIQRSPDDIMEFIDP